MMLPLYRIAAVIRLTCLLLILFPPLLLATPLPVESFSQLPKYQKVVLSPDGKKVAFIQNVNDLSILSVLDIAKRQMNHLVKSDNVGVRIKWFDWANENTLIISLNHVSKRSRTKTNEARLYAMAVDGSEQKPRDLFKKNRTVQKEREPQFQDQVIDMLPDDPDHILIGLDTEYFNMPTAFKLNLTTLKRETIEGGKSDIRDWVTDQQHQIRGGFALDYETGLARILISDKPGGKFEERFRYNSFSEPEINILGFDLDPNILYYSANHAGRLALFKLDLATDTSEIVFKHDRYDVDGALIYSDKTGAVIGVHHRSGESGQIIWDPERSNLQDRLEATFPNTFNDLTSFSRDENFFILRVENDYTPGIYYLVDRQAYQFTGLFQTYPQLATAGKTDHKLMQYTARDGLKIEGYLTRPVAATGPTPTILHPHGGPGARAHGGFDYWTSYFVNRGYTVFRPNFRGSTGYGFKFSAAQYESWGLEMQDDLEDAVKWLVEESLADPDKVCIVGASYGGYAAMLAAAKSPELFQCAISFAGVSDLKSMIDKHRNFTNYEFVKKQIGSKSRDLKSRSPLYQVDNIELPILLIHGDIDRVVSIDHSSRMAAALKREKKPHRFVKLKDGDHYLKIQRNRHLTFKEMDKFLHTYLLADPNTAKSR
tara:strand:- start:968 stop:2932 length:1965 start_codon:yes stop_codon:yes gene_type:complete